MDPNALWHLSSETSALRPAKRPENREGLVEIKSLYSLVSTGTERLVARGQVPASSHEAMQVPGMEGDFRFPLKYGYSLVGKVQMPGHKWHGLLVHALYPHQERAWVPEELVVPIPQGIPPLRATLASNMETAINALWDSGAGVGDKVLLVGFGMIGALLARLLREFPGVALWIVEKQHQRITMARQMGFQVLPAETRPTDFDLAFHTSATGSGLQTALDAVGMEGRVVELSWYGARELKLQLGTEFHYNRKQLISSQVSHIPFARQSRWDYRRRRKLALRLLKNPAFDEHITHAMPLEDSPAFFQELRRGEAAGLGYAIAYQKEN